MSLSLATERMAICVTTISYDRDVPGEDDRAMKCYTELSEAFIAQGYPPYRLSVASMHLVDAARTPYGSTVRVLKSALDPGGVLAPGRYEPPL
jgi:4-cresol dehydrogenase (hydroxylating)